MTTTRLTTLAGLGALLCACAGGSGELDGKDDSFGGVKNDGRYTSCQLVEVVNFVREPTTDVNLLVDEVGLHSDAARAIVSYQDGPDGQRGTADDQIIENLTELDQIDFVGLIALDRLVGAILDRCEIDLGVPGDPSTAERPYINADTFAGTSGGGWTRDAIEMEATFALHGLSSPQLNSILSETNSRGRTRFERMVNDLEDVFGALTLGDHPYESNWNSAANDLREQVKYVALTIESGRKMADVDDEWFSAGTGTDLMEDHYFSTFNGALQGNGILIRARNRIDEDPSGYADPCETPMRRVLVQTKFSPEIGPDGVKRGGKVDTRATSSTMCDEISTSVVPSAMWGQSDWDGSLKPLEPIRVAYDALKEAGGLLDIGAFVDVLLLNPTAALWSERSRFHYDLASTSSIQTWFTNGLDQVDWIMNQAQAARDRADVTSAERAEIDSVLAAGQAILDGSAVVARANAIEPSLGLTDVTYPHQWETAASKNELDRNKIIADAIDQVFSDFDDLVDDMDLDDIVSRADEAGSDNLVEPYMIYKRMTNSSLTEQRAAIPYYSEYFVESSNEATAIANFTAHCQEQVAAGNDDFEDCESVSATQWRDLGRHLLASSINHSRRMVEAAGVVTHALWFHQYRRYYFGSMSTWGNFMIVTFDWTQAVSERVWDEMTPVERYHGIPAENIFWTTLVQENQVELTATGPVEVIEKKTELQALIDAGTATAEERELYEAATFILNTYLDSEVALAEASSEIIVDELEDQSGVSGLSWAPALGSKGEQALSKMTTGNLE